MAVDPQIKQFATERQAEIIEAVENEGGVKPASRAIGVHPKTIRKAIAGAEKRAVKHGYSPLADHKGYAPEGYQVRGKSTLYDKDGNVSAQWVKTCQDDERQLLAMQEAVQAMAESIPPAEPVAAPASTLPDLLNFFAVSDYHLGMLAWHEETGADWDTSIAENALYEWFAQAIRLAPDAETAVFADLGDWGHWDGLDAVTPTNGHVLDVDTRFQKLVRVTIRAFRRVVQLLLAKHQHVHLIVAEGNHNPASSAWMRELTTALYEDEPRVTVDTSASPYYCYEHGETAIFVHHGHKRKPGDVAEVFASQFREVYGRTTKAYGHTGHRHHRHVIETPLMVVEQHPTLAAPDAYAARGGYLSERTAHVISYHRQHGEVSRVSIPASQLEST